VAFLLRRYPALTLREILLELNVMNISELVNADILLTERSREIADFFSD
jgi:hypothetical protein